MQQDSRLYVLVARKLAGEATNAELRELKELLGEHFEHEYIYEMLSAYWKQEPDALSPDDDNSQVVLGGSSARLFLHRSFCRNRKCRTNLPAIPYLSRCVAGHGKNGCMLPP